MEPKAHINSVIAGIFVGVANFLRSTGEFPPFSQLIQNSILGYFITIFAAAIAIGLTSIYRKKKQQEDQFESDFVAAA